MAMMDIHMYWIVLFLYFLPSARSQVCPYGWNSDRASSKSCYLITSNIRRTWPEAKAFCTQMQGSLLKIDTLAERTWILRALHAYQRAKPSSQEWWIGLHDNPAQTNVMWTDRSAPDTKLLNWSPGEPSTYDRNDACVEYANGTLRHQNCSLSRFYICERPKDKAVWCDSTRRWEHIDNQCYKSFRVARSWDDARAECQRENGDLFVVKDASTEAVLYNYIESRRTGMWIGLRAFKNTQGNPVFKWLEPTGDTLVPLNSFWSRTPLSTDVDANYTNACVFANVTLTNPNVWQLADCSMRSFFLCQKDKGTCAAGWIRYKDRCYFLQSRQRLGWNDANQYCTARKADLLQVHSPEDQTFIDKSIRSSWGYGINSIWLGITDNNKDGGPWVYGNGMPVPINSTSYTNFAGNHDNRPGVQDCFNIFTDDVNGTWQRANNCSDLKPFFCSIGINVSPTVPTTPAPTSAGTTTPSTVTWGTECGPFWVEDQKSGTCYQFHDNTVTWEEARAQCENAGAQLASITSYQEQRFLADRLFGYQSPALWLGVNNLNRNEGFQWVDGAGFGFFNWAPGEPNNVYNSEHCGELITSGPTVGMWNDDNCNQQRGYICKRAFRTTVAPTMPTAPAGQVFGCANPMLVGYGRYCYLFSTTRTSWNNAKLFCESHGLNFASIVDESEQNFIFSQIKAIDRSQYWIGLSDSSSQMNFNWTDGSLVTYTHWSRNEPNNYQSRREDCITMFAYNGEWNDEVCENPQSGFVCKTPKAVMPKPSTKMSNCSWGDAVEYGSYCYSFMESGPMKNWQDADKQCRSVNGGSLASVHEAKTQAFLASQMKYRRGYYWIGLSNTGKGGNLGWTDGKTVDFTAWSGNHTGNENGTCVGMSSRHPVGLWWNLDCSVSRYYICQAVRQGYTVPTAVPTTPRPIPCPSGWKEYNGHCYKGYTAQAEKKSWSEARRACELIGANLLSLHSSYDEQFVFSYSVVGYSYRGSFWLGLNDFGTEKVYKWSDMSPVNYTNWGRGEPNDWTGEDDCVEYNTASRNWNDNDCNIAKSYVCKLRKGKTLITPVTTAAPILPGCSGDADWKFWNGSCYFAASQYNRKTWYDARQYCMDYGGDLTSIHSTQENGFIINLITASSDTDVWVGATDVGANNFRWSDGTPFDYEKWNGDEPNDAFGSERCTQMGHYNSYWNDNNCNELYSFVCKRTLGHTKPVTVAPTATIPGGCPAGFKTVPQSNKCYKLIGAVDRESSLMKNFTSARDDCRSMGLQYDIASITSAKEQAFLIYLVDGLSLKTHGLWIGMDDLNKNQRFTWTDNTPLRFTNWGKGEPERSGGNCVEIYTEARRAGKWHNIRCENTRGYICQTSRNASLPSNGPPLPTCHLPGYFSNGQNCYKVDMTPRTWKEAEASCVNNGTKGHLASIQTVYEKAFVDLLTANVAGPVWIGLSDVTSPGTYVWSDHWPVQYSSWAQDEPTWIQGEGCVTTSKGQWNDTVCTDKYPSICKQGYFNYLAPTPPAGGYCLDKSWRQFDDYCYYIELHYKYNWAYASETCERKGMHLASVHSIAEENFILGEIDTASEASANVWLNMRKTGGYFSWADGSAVDYVHWDDGQPGDIGNVFHQDCVALKHDTGRWENVKCYSSNGFVCKAAKVAQTPSSPSTSTSPSTPTVTMTTASTRSPVNTRTLPSGFEPISETGGSTTQRAGRATGGSTSTAVNIVPTANGQPSQQASSVGSDLSGGQVAGIVIGVLVLLVLVCGFLLVMKRKSGSQIFSFIRMRDGNAFDNALYDKSEDKVNINGHSNGSIKAKSNGHSAAFQDFADPNEENC